MRQLARQPVQAWNHPAPEETAGAAQHQRIRCRLPAHGRPCRAQRVEGRRCGLVQALTERRQRQVEPLPGEQRSPQRYLEDPYLTADRTVGPMQLIGREECWERVSPYV